MDSCDLREIDGQKIRRQYFALFILTNVACVCFIPNAMLIIPLQMGNFVLSEWFSSIGTSIGLCTILSIPWLILSALNRSYFDQIICVLTREGIHYDGGFIQWDKIKKIEYETELPIRYRAVRRYRNQQYCRAVIFTEKESIVLLHAPFYILARARKMHPEIPCGVSKRSKRTIAFIVFALLVVIPLVGYFKK